MRIEDFGPYQQAAKADQSQQQARRLARALMQVLRLQPGLELGPILGMGVELSNQQALEAWVQRQLEQGCEHQEDTLAVLAQRVQREMSDRWD